MFNKYLLAALTGVVLVGLVGPAQAFEVGQQLLNPLGLGRELQLADLAAEDPKAVLDLDHTRVDELKRHEQRIVEADLHPGRQTELDLVLIHAVQKRAGLADQLLGCFIQAHLRPGWIPRPMIHLQHVFHARDELGVLLRRNAPVLAQVRLKFVFLSVRFTAMWLHSSTCFNATI